MARYDLEIQLFHSFFGALKIDNIENVSSQGVPLNPRPSITLPNNKATSILIAIRHSFSLFLKLCKQSGGTRLIVACKKFIQLQEAMTNSIYNE